MPQSHRLAAQTREQGEPTSQGWPRPGGKTNAPVCPYGPLSEAACEQWWGCHRGFCEPVR